MKPYYYIKEATKGNKSLLSLCCGIGLELYGLNIDDITAVDIAPQYIKEVESRCPQAKLVVSDALEYLNKQDDSSVDVISIIDGIEHMDKQTGLKVIEEMKRVVREKILLYTPQGPSEDGFLRNEPHNAWEIEGADHFQLHRSGWTLLELKDLGFRLIQSSEDLSQHGEKFDALMTEWDK